jgi:hypothetical protein
MRPFIFLLLKRLNEANRSYHRFLRLLFEYAPGW